jgi:thioredoxin reductase
VVVGGGDSAIEAAVGLAEEPGTTVTVSYRGAAFARCKQQNRAKIEALSQQGRIRILFESGIESISPQSIAIRHGGRVAKVKCDAVIICAGGIVPSGFLKSIGIEIETKYGTA